jgi:transcriptional regulator with XRE-family HTH domain
VTTDPAVSPHTIDWASLGATIRERRQARSLTLVEVAARSDLSQPFLSQVETGRARPSMESLYRIARALGTTPQALFGAAHDASHEPTLVRHTEARTVRADDRTESVCHLLLAGEAPFHVLEYDGLPSEFREPWVHEGYEATYVLSGTIEIDLAATVSRLEAGDLLSYPATIPHRLRAVGRRRARVLMIETGTAGRPTTTHTIDPRVG